ncbi:NAD-dependent epimerase/dehydratase family protein [Runella aurantiaca]|uniref:NAD-dependent epimerase/dehydratase family protein n=1 Tax=Runella aurantiaca TaxID=2282308 RepID=A0A369IKL1_9BACT|nr:NAD-dependent epimerase/dehydratase family protein [Runella aurantiaca]RDB07903.1 NAD-dependent epimerase/dehydratase family protein [Runella aurantiaca]
MKIFITGITGLLGRHVAELCFREGHEIFALVRDKKINNSNFPFELEICYGDLSTLDSIPEKLNHSEIVIHCAANTSMLSIKNTKQEETNINGIRNLIIVSKQANIKKFIHVSSANTIAHGDIFFPADESKKLALADYRLPYINTKIIGEEILLNEFKVNNFPVIILNPTFILGPCNLNISSGKLILAAIKKPILLFPSGGKNIVDVRDIARVIVNSIHKGKTGNNYLLSNENLTYKEIFTLACKYANVVTPKFKIPYSLGVVIGYMGSCFELITKKTTTINIKTMRLSYQNHYYNADKAIKELCFTPRPAKETIKDTVSWFKNEHISN